MRTEPETLLRDLVTAGVLVEHDDGERLEPSTRYLRERESWRRKLNEGGKPVERYAVSLDTDPEKLDETIIAGALAIQEMALDIDNQTAVLAADGLARFIDDTLDEGVPDGFIPVRANEISAFVKRHDGTVVYLWGDDCKPCDRMREELEALLEQNSLPDEVELGAVYLGREAEIDPETIDLIGDEWMVTVVPTTLFFLNGQIDSRYYGSKPKEAVKREIEILAGYVKDEDVSIDTPDVEDLAAGDSPVEGDRDGGATDAPEAKTDLDVTDATGLFPADGTDRSSQPDTARVYLEEMTAEGENISIGDGNDENPEDVDGSTR